jgi:hypothetical protein
MKKIAYKLNQEGKISQVLDINSRSCSQEGVIITDSTDPLYQEYSQEQNVIKLQDAKNTLIDSFKKKYDILKYNVVINITKDGIVRPLDTQEKPETIIYYLQNSITNNAFPCELYLDKINTYETITSLEDAQVIINKLTPYTILSYKIDYMNIYYGNIFKQILDSTSQEELNLINTDNIPTIIITYP